jgi:sugar lactone lactonase YvrE
MTKAKLLASTLLPLILPLILLSACNSDDDNKKSTPSNPTLIQAWQLEGLSTPESALYDANSNAIYVSNVNSGDTSSTTPGFISKVNLDGTMNRLKWISGLKSPKGMGVHNNTLYVSDLDQLVEIDIIKGEITQIHPIASAQFLNDLVVDTNGVVYLSDTFGHAIFKIKEGVVIQLAHSDKLESPNGLAIHNNDLLIASWGNIIDFTTFATEVPGSVHSISLDGSNTEIKTVGSQTELGNLDGIEEVSTNTFLISDWVKGEIFQWNTKGDTQTLLTIGELGSAADIEYIPTSHTLLIPQMMQNKLSAYTYSH